MSAGPLSRGGRGASLALLGVTAVWGSTFVVVQDAVARMPVMDFLLWRFAVAAVAMAAIRPGAVRRLTPDSRRAGVLLGLALGAGYVTQTFGLLSTPAAVSGFVTGTFVVLTPLCAAVLLRHRVEPVAWLGVAAATVGLAVLALRGLRLGAGAGVEGGAGAGELLTLACALAFALHIVGLGRWAPGTDAVGLSVVQLTTVAGLCLPFALVGGLTVPPDAGVWAAVALTALAATALAFLVQTWAQVHLAPTRAAVIMTMEPVFAGVFAVLIGGEQLGWPTLAGAALVLAAMLVVEVGPRAGAEGAVARLEV